MYCRKQSEHVSFATPQDWGTGQGSMEDEADAFDAIADQLAELRMGAAAEQLDEAREIVVAGIAARTFADQLRNVPLGDVLTLTATDGVALRGRILQVGADWVRLGEVADDEGTLRVQLRRVHDVRLDAVVRITREVDG
jgi:hypothetical protein